MDNYIYIHVQDKRYNMEKCLLKKKRFETNCKSITINGDLILNYIKKLSHSYILFHIYFIFIVLKPIV